MSQEEWENLASLLSLVVGAGVFLALWLGAIPGVLVKGVDRVIDWLSQPRRIWFLLIPMGCLALCVGITLRNGIPHAFIHDEFSYLLAADTFAHGRLTNPTPAFWEHFETPHELMQPTYMSKYPPAQGIALAVGQVITGKPIFGVCLSTALAALTIYWMLLGFVSARWAIVGGIMAAIHPQLIDWSRDYWGGTVAVLGGAIVLGAWGRLMVAGGMRASILLGIGLLILANSRPYEGLLVSAALVVPLVMRGVREGRLVPRFNGAVVVLLLGAAAMGYYNLRITGHVLRMPFVEYARQYDVYPKFWFLPVRAAPVYHNATMEFVHLNFEKGLYETLRTPVGFIRISWARALELVNTNTKVIVLLLPLVVGLCSVRDQRIRLVVVAVVFSLLGLLAENFVQPHYEAPTTGLFLLLIMVGLRQLWGWCWQTRPVGRWLAIGCVLGFVSGAVLADAQPAFHDRQLVEQPQAVEILPPLKSGRHLIFVVYAPMHSLHNEYVYNQADLDSSRLIWARSFGPESDLPVAKHFGNRHVWLLYVGGKLDLKPYLTEQATH